MFGIDLPSLGEGSGGERLVGSAVDFARQSLGGLEQGFDRGGLEQRQYRAGELDPMNSMGGDSVFIERRTRDGDVESLLYSLH